MYLGTKGGFFKTYIFGALPPCRFVCHTPLLCTNSNTLFFFSEWLLVRVYLSHQRHISTDHMPSPPGGYFSFPFKPSHMTSYLWLITPQTSIATIEFICLSWLKSPPPSVSATLPASADSHLNLSSLISGSSFVDVDALTSSPTTSTTSHYADAASAASSVSLSFLSLHHEIYSMNSFVMKSYFNANIWIHIIHYSPRSYEFISFVNDMNS